MYYRQYNLRSSSDDARDRRRPLPVRAFPPTAHRARPATRTQRVLVLTPALSLSHFSRPILMRPINISANYVIMLLRVFMRNKVDLSLTQFMMLPTYDKTDRCNQHPFANFPVANHILYTQFTVSRFLIAYFHL